MRRISSSPKTPAVSLGELLVRDQHLVDEAARAPLQVELLGGQAVRGRGRGGGHCHALSPLGRFGVARLRRLARPRARLSWFSRMSSIAARASASDSSPSADSRQRRRLGEVGVPLPAASMGHETLDPHALPLHQLGRRGAAGAQRRGRHGQLALRFRCQRQPCVAGAQRTHMGHDIMRLITKSGSRMASSAPPQRPFHPPSRPTCTSTRRPAARGRAHLLAHLAVRRARLAARRAGHLPHRQRGHAAGAGRARRRGRAARVPQRLPAPRLAAPERLGRVQEGDPLPLPRLDLPDRRRADRRARGPPDPRPRQVRARALPGARRGHERPRVREPRHPRDAARRAGRRPARSGSSPTASSA